MRIGYAPNDWNSVVDFVRISGLDVELMQEMGILKKSEKTHYLNCIFHNRLMIPIRDRFGNIEGFTARALDDNATCKYLNSSNSELYQKSRSIFGIDSAVNIARMSGELYLVEGAPDVMKLQSIGIPNVIASLGGSWTEEQFLKLKDYNLKDCTLCFIPDSDIPHNGEQLGAGFKNVLRNGEKAMRLGFIVSVKEIPNDLTVSHPKKIDPDEFFNEKADMEKLSEREFLIWAFEKRFNKDATAEDKQKLIKDTCEILLLIKDKALRDRYITELAKIDGKKTNWKQTLKDVASHQKRKKLHRADANGAEVMESFGFTEKQGSYWGFGSDDTEEQWSNFTLKPLFHIKDDLCPVRLFEIKNNEPGSQSEIVELDMDMFTSSKSLRKKLIGLGNYTWLGNDNSLIKLQRYLAKVTETAIEVKQLGWHKEGFYCFCNGVMEDGEWHDVDEMGIVRLKTGNYYLPAMSKLFKDSKELYANERKFCHHTSSNISLHDYFEKIVDVFGKNAIVGLCFFLATLYRDIIYSKKQFFPLLNIFGPMGSGKTKLGQTLTSFFVADNTPEGIDNTSLPALSDLVSSVSNALVQIDEYKNGVEIRKVEFLKNLWGGVGRSRMNMEKDKKREQAKVDSGIILTGQEMPTADIALFSRIIYLTYEMQHHTEEERAKFNDLLGMRLRGATHITLEILKHRKNFENRFDEAWRKAEYDVELGTKGHEIIDRIEGNWLVPLSAFLALDGLIDTPFNYEELLKVCIDGIIRQNEMCVSIDEIANFWFIFCSAKQKNEVKYGQDYFIKTKTKLKTNKFKEGIPSNDPIQVLMIRKESALATYENFGGIIKARLLPSESMLFYLKTSPDYLGTAKNTERFQNVTKSGMPTQVQVKENGHICYKNVYSQERPLCFDYKKVCERYDFNLDLFTEDSKVEDNKPTPDAVEQVLPL